MRYLGRGRGEGKQVRYHGQTHRCVRGLSGFQRKGKIVAGSAFGTSVAILLSGNRVMNPTYQWKNISRVVNQCLSGLCAADPSVTCAL